MSASKKNTYLTEHERNRRTRIRVYLILPLVFIALSIAAVVFVLLNQSAPAFHNFFIYLSTGLMDAAMLLIAWESICWVFTNDSTGRKVGIFFCWLFFLAGTVYAWVHWNQIASLTGQINALYDAIDHAGADASALKTQIESLSQKRLNLNLNIIILQLIRLLSLCGCLAISWTGSKKEDIAEHKITAHKEKTATAA